MSDLELLISRFNALGVLPPTELQERLAMLTVCEAMSASGSAHEEIREVLRALGLEPVASPRVPRGLRSHTRSR
jgi:hypothetical protein